MKQTNKRNHFIFHHSEGDEEIGTLNCHLNGGTLTVSLCAGKLFFLLFNFHGAAQVLSPVDIFIPVYLSAVQLNRKSSQCKV